MQLVDSHRSNSIIISRIALILSLLFVGINGLAAKGVRLDYLGDIDKKEADTTPFFNVFHKLEWDMKLINSKGAIREIITERPDTVIFTEQVTINLSTSFSVGPQLLDEIAALHFKLSGSLLVKLNDRKILATGSFSDSTNKNLISLFLNDYTDFVFKDTAARLEIVYIPLVKTSKFDVRVEVGQQSWKIKKVDEKNIEDNKAFALGFYFLAFGIIFIILFLYHKEKTENVYFALFCFFASIAYLWGKINLGIFDNAPGIITVILFAALSFEFLAIFFAKVLRNKVKSKIPLGIIIVVTIASFHPSIRYFSATSISLSETRDGFLILMFVLMCVLLVYTLVSCLYFLIRGFGQKRWEAKTITLICFFNLIITILLPVVANPLFTKIESAFPFMVKIFEYLTEIGLCVYPLSVALVLGRRNGENQKQLVSQITSIEQLSFENLEKEKEKKLILEDLNSQLEQKVSERTLEVMHQKEVIELKSKALTENINYAQRIQSAILPDINLIYRTLKQSFVLFQPKDIVSGDFYAFAEKNDRVLIVAGDCTGHGVSGAFMSMIASSLLNQIINERGVVEPALILNQLNISIIETLRQSENESNDGMDISICSLNLTTMELQYAGANRPLWLVRDNEIIVHKPDKFPIGGLQMARDRFFTNHIVQLLPADTIYIFTDGYADQFGGDQGKKMMTGKFREKLLSIQHKDMNEQLIDLKQHFDTWKGNNEQVDDVLVIGIRI